jgi:hypothetical protein
MDWTNDDPQQPPNTAPGCQYQPPQPSSNIYNSGSQSRDDRHYDPVHDTSGWHPYSGVNSQSRPSFPPQPPQSNFSQWATGAYTPSWPRFGEIQPGAQGQGHDPSSHRPQAGSMGIPHASWEFQGHSLPYGYGSAYAGSTTRPNGRLAADQSIGVSIQVPLAGADSTQLSFPSNPAQASTIQQQLSLAQDLSTRHRTSITPSDPTQQPPDATATLGNSFRNGPMPPGSLTELRNGKHSQFSFELNYLF